MRELTISEAVGELHEKWGLTVNRKAVQRRCVAGKVACRRTPQGWYLIPESQLKVLAEGFRKKGY